MLLFWIGRTNVGGARISWSRGSGVQRFELLIGSDPQRAPMRINRWGYLAETVCDTTAEVVGVMTESEEQSIDEAKASVEREPGGGHAFKAIRSSLASGESSATVTRFLLADDLTYRDVETLLRRRPPDGAAVQRLRMPEGTAPGFLVAVAGLIHESVEAYRTSGRVRERPMVRRVYAYNAQLYDLTLRSSRVVPQTRVKDWTYDSAIESEFATRNRTTQHTTTFRITYGTREPVAEVPIRIVYRPKWWFEAELLLDDGKPL
jgi:hypothetical protein